MLLHIRPKLISPFKHVALIDLVIPEFGLRLAGGTDLATRRPYPNKTYAVGCRKIGQKAIDGFLIERAGVVDQFHTVARWAVQAEVVVTHFVEYKVLDHEFDTASDSMILWHACSEELGGWSNRRPSNMDSVPAMYVEPTMEVFPDSPRERPSTEDDLDPRTGLISVRRQAFSMPTIERDRLLRTRFDDRLPGLEQAFRC